MCAIIMTVHTHGVYIQVQFTYTDKLVMKNGKTAMNLIAVG